MEFVPYMQILNFKNRFDIFLDLIVFLISGKSRNLVEGKMAFMI